MKERLGSQTFLASDPILTSQSSGDTIFLQLVFDQFVSLCCKYRVHSILFNNLNKFLAPSFEIQVTQRGVTRKVTQYTFQWLFYSFCFHSFCFFLKTRVEP